VSATTQERIRGFWRVARTTLLGAVFAAICAFILASPMLPSEPEVALGVGDVATENIQAPDRVVYVSEIDTERLREEAVGEVADIYDPPDARVGRQQARRARQIATFILNVRHDTFASPELRAEYVGQITALTLSEETTAALLNVNDSQFDSIMNEAAAVLEEVMSGAVREGRLADATTNLALRVSVDVPEEYVPVVTDIAADLVVPNSRLNTSATDAARTAAAAAVVPVEHTIERGEVIIRAGEIVTESDLEALQHLGLVQETTTWQDIVSPVLASILSTALLAVYLVAFQRRWLESNPFPLILLAALFIFLLVGARLMVPGRTVIPYLFPVATLAFVVRAVIGPNSAAVAAVTMAALTGFIGGNSLELTAYAGLGGLIATISLRRPERISQYFLSGLFVALAQIGVVFVFRLPDPYTDSLGLLQLTIAALVNGLLSAGLALALLYIIGIVADLPTGIRLLDLTRPDHPLQQRLQRDAPGTYQHTLQVTNLTEAAAEAIGANGLLARVGALYHDIGKTARPYFFIENRLGGATNPHDRLDPYTSAKLIRDHVKDGIDLARQYRLPRRVRAFIPEHHGTMPMLFFLNKAREQAAQSGAEVNERDFVYEGPRPQSRETAVLMLADACESAIRANQPSSVEEVNEIIGRIIRQRIDRGQLDESGLSLTDLKIIQQTFVNTLKGMYHPRVQYPPEAPPPAAEAPAGDRSG
jgi:putative nucleotidyltransferase with HDIG domain